MTGLAQSGSGPAGTDGAQPAKPKKDPLTLGPEELTKFVNRLERRLDRERRVRYEVEAIAERGTLDLYLQTQELQQARHDAQVASRVKTDLLDGLSHELRTPLNGVLGMIELLQASITEEQERMWLRTAEESSQRMYRLVVRLLDAIALESADFSDVVKAVPAKKVVSELEGYWRPRLLPKGQLLSVENFLPDDACLLDHEHFVRKGCDELLRNVKDHAVSGSVVLAASGDTETVTITVSDGGPGIDPDELELLRQPLFKRDSKAWPGNGGLGLGLGLVGRLCDALGGSWSIISTAAGTDAALTVRRCSGG